MQRLAGFMRTYWTRGTPGRPTPQSLQVLMLRWWLVAFAFKLLGSSWDVSWHFKWLRDDLAPPHLVNTVGTGIAIALVLAHTFTGYGADRVSLRIMQLGTVIFVIAGPIDVINHRINGLDLTAWSPSHMLLYAGTSVMVVGVIRVFYRAYPRDGRTVQSSTDGRTVQSHTDGRTVESHTDGRTVKSHTDGRTVESDTTGGFRWQWTAGMVVLWTFLFEDAFFPNLQQEYGILEVGSWFRGSPYAEPSLLDFAAKQIGRPVDDVAVQHFALPIPAWVYPVWTVVVCAAVLVFARIMIGRRWAATAVTALYLGYRLIIWPLLVVGTFPPSSVPFWLLLVGLAVDGVFLIGVPAYARAVVGALVVTGAAYLGLFLETVIEGSPTNLAGQSIEELRALHESGGHLHTPPVAWGSIWWAALGLLLTWSAATWIAGRTIGLDTRRPPELAVTFGPEPRRDARGYLDGWPEPDTTPPELITGVSAPAPDNSPSKRSQRP